MPNQEEVKIKVTPIAKAPRLKFDVLANCVQATAKRLAVASAVFGIVATGVAVSPASGQVISETVTTKAGFEAALSNPTIQVILIGGNLTDAQALGTQTISRAVTIRASGATRSITGVLQAEASDVTIEGENSTNRLAITGAVGVKSAGSANNFTLQNVDVTQATSLSTCDQIIAGNNVCGIVGLVGGSGHRVLNSNLISVDRGANPGGIGPYRLLMMDLTRGNVLIEGNTFTDGGFDQSRVGIEATNVSGANALTIRNNTINFTGAGTPRGGAFQSRGITLQTVQGSTENVTIENNSITILATGVATNNGGG